MPLDRPPRPLIGAQVRRRDPQLSSHELDHPARQIRSGGREPAMTRVELQRKRKAQALASRRGGRRRRQALQHLHVLELARVRDHGRLSHRRPSGTLKDRRGRRRRSAQLAAVGPPCGQKRADRQDRSCEHPDNHACQRQPPVTSLRLHPARPAPTARSPVAHDTAGGHRTPPRASPVARSGFADDRVTQGLASRRDALDKQHFAINRVHRR